MNTIDLILQELQEIPEGLLDQVLNFVRFLTVEQERQLQEDQEDLADSRVAREEAKEKGTISLQTLTQELGLFRRSSAVSAWAFRAISRRASSCWWDC